MSCFFSVLTYVLRVVLTRRGLLSTGDASNEQRTHEAERVGLTAAELEAIGEKKYDLSVYKQATQASQGGAPITTSSFSLESITTTCPNLECSICLADIVPGEKSRMLLTLALTLNS
jgi:hypothetical protein